MSLFNTIMEQELRRLILIVEEDLQAWTNWHCKKEVCKHHMCKVRKQKLSELNYLHTELHLRWKMVRNGNREISCV